MNRLNQKKKITVIAAVSAVLLLGIVVYTVTRNIKSEDFYQRASGIDYNTASGFYEQAESQLSQLFNKIKNKQTALSFLKRSEKLSALTGDWQDFGGYAAELSSRFGNNIEIAAINSYAMYMNGNYKGAIESSRQKLGRSEYNSIYLVSSVRTDEEIEDKKILEKIPPEYKLFFKDSTPELSEILAASGIIKDDRLLIDAALIYMKNGESGHALEMLKRMKNPPAELGMFIAFDNGELETAGSYFNEIDVDEALPEIMMFGADILISTGRADAAALIYEKILADEPDFSWIPYRNMYSAESDYDSRLKWLESGLKIFPGQDELLLPMAWEKNLKSGSLDEQRFEPILNPEKNSPLSELFRINTVLGNRSPEHIIGNYWNIFNRAPDSVTISTAFANYLLRNRSFAQLEMLISRFTETNGPSAWADGYAAVSLCMQGNDQDALLKIRSALEEEETTSILFNMAVINERCGAGGDTLQWLEKAASTAEIEGNVQALSAVYFKTAETYYNLFEYEKADKYIKKTLRLNPDDIRSSLLLKKIEEGYND